MYGNVSKYSEISQNNQNIFECLLLLILPALYVQMQYTVHSEKFFQIIELTTVKNERKL